MAKTYFTSYGDNNYINSKKRLEQEAKDFGLFDHIKIYGREDLDNDFVEKTKPWIDMPRGGGYWLYKSYVLKKTFELMEEGDFLVYIDTGCSINPYGRDTFKSYLKMLEEDEKKGGMIRFSYEKTAEELYTNEKAFEFFGKKDDKEFRNTDILMNGIIIFMKTENSQNYIDEYFRITITEPILFSDHYNYDHCNVYKDYRHDQSISSILVKLNGNFIQLDDHSYGSDYNMWMDLVHNRKIPFLATRIRG